MPLDTSVDPRAGPSPVGPISVWRGSYASLPATMLKPPTEGNRTIPVSVNWLTDGQSPSYAVAFNARLQQVLNFTQICAVHVDNTRCSTAILIVFPDTGFAVKLPPNSEGFYPVITNGLDFVAFCALTPVSGDVTVIQVMNFLPPPVQFDAGAPGVAAGTVRQINTTAPIQGGPITDTGTVSITTPITVNFGGTGAITAPLALDNLSGASGATAGVLARSGAGAWSVTAAGAGTITGVTAGAGLTGGGTSGSVSLALTSPVNVANGGTGSGTAAGALTNLGAAPINAPAFTGNASLITPPPLNDNSHSIVSSDWVKSQGFSTTAALVSTQNNVGRNLVHNPLFNIQQRGAGPFASPPNAFTADRWMLASAAADTASATLPALNDSQRAVIGDEAARTALAVAFTGSASGVTFIQHSIEGVRRLAGKTVTLSFWAGGSVANVGVAIFQLFGSGGSPSAAVRIGPSVINLTAAFARYSVTFSVPSAAGKTFGTNNDDTYSVRFYCSAGAPGEGANAGIGVQSGSLNLWGVQLEIGSDTTPLEKPDPQQDLAKCQRFYQTCIVDSNQMPNAAGTISSQYSFPVVMRASPTIGVTVTGSGNAAGPATAVQPGSVKLYWAAGAAGASFMTATLTATADL